MIWYGNFLTFFGWSAKIPNFEIGGYDFGLYLSLIFEFDCLKHKSKVRLFLFGRAFRIQWH